VTFDDQFSKAVRGEASWKTSDFDQAADRYAIDFSRGVRDVVVNTLELQVAREPSGCRPRCCSPTSSGPPNEPPAAGDRRWQSCSTTMTRAAHRWSSGKAGG
jgi:hypothetical protein